MGIIECRRQIHSLLMYLINSYFTKIGLDTVSHLQPTQATGVDGVKVIFYGEDKEHMLF